MGLHASDLYGSYFKKMQPDRYDKRDAKGKEIPMSMSRVELGFTLEQIIERVMAERLLGARPPEMRAPHTALCAERKRRIAKGEHCKCGGGTYFSPDYLFDEDGELILGEFKVTWMSLLDAPHARKFDKYKAQMLLYAFWLNVKRARLFVYFVNGPWSSTKTKYEPFTPVPLAWEFEFTQRELDDNYNRLVKHGLKVGLL